MHCTSYARKSIKRVVHQWHSYPVSTFEQCFLPWIWHFYSWYIFTQPFKLTKRHAVIDNFAFTLYYLCYFLSIFIRPVNFITFVISLISTYYKLHLHIIQSLMIYVDDLRIITPFFLYYSYHYIIAFIVRRTVIPHDSGYSQLFDHNVMICNIISVDKKKVIRLSGMAWLRNKRCLDNLGSTVIQLFAEG